MWMMSVEVNGSLVFSPAAVSQRPQKRWVKPGQSTNFVLNSEAVIREKASQEEPMKSTMTLLIPLFFFNSLALAARDSVAVFHRPEKVAVQVIDYGTDSRLQKLMNLWQANTRLYWKNQDESFYINCGRNERKVSCTLRFLPSESCQISDHQAIFQAELDEPLLEGFVVSFESSRGNSLKISIDSQVLEVHASKKPLISLVQ